MEFEPNLKRFYKIFENLAQISNSHRFFKISENLAQISHIFQSMKRRMFILQLFDKFAGCWIFFLKMLTIFANVDNFYRTQVNLCYATWWPTLQTMKMAPPDDQMLSQFKLCHLLDKFATNFEQFAHLVSKDICSFNRVFQKCTFSKRNKWRLSKNLQYKNFPFLTKWWDPLELS